METQLQKSTSEATRFNGNNFCDNEVIVDFENKKVDFTPVDEVTPFDVWFGSLFSTIVVLGHILIWGLFFLTITIGGIYKIFGYNFLIVITYFTSFMIGSGIFVVFVSWVFCTKVYRLKIFPKYNAMTSEIMTWLILNPSLWKTYREVSDNNTIIFDDFKNIYMKYEVTEDFAKYISRIEITAPFKEIPLEGKKRKKPRYWMCKFIFKQKPLKGYLKVKYY